MRSHSVRLSACALTTLVALSITAQQAQADEWRFTITVDNQSALYLGSNTSTSQLVGGDNDWTDAETYTATNAGASDYVYVACASDHQTLQGFLGYFENLTSGAIAKTGDSSWQVFPAGAYAAQLNNPNPWPNSVMPTQTQVDNAIAYASSQNLWEATDGFAGWDNDETTAPPSGYTTDYWSGELQFMLPFQEAGIPKNTQWIWHDSTEADPSSGIPDPFRGANHDEFLIFRVPGAVPEPATLGALSLGAMLLLRRSRT